MPEDSASANRLRGGGRSAYQLKTHPNRWAVRLPNSPDFPFFECKGKLLSLFELISSAVCRTQYGTLFLHFTPFSPSLSPLIQFDRLPLKH